MERKILCEACGSVLNEDILKQKHSENTCLVCGASLGVEESESVPKEELVTWYYYSLPKAGYYLSYEFLDNKDFYHLEYKFKAPKDLEAAKEILRKEYDSTAFAMSSENSQLEPRCPHCGSTNIQLIPRKWSVWTGFRTNKVDRVCVNCKHRF